MQQRALICLLAAGCMSAHMAHAECAARRPFCEALPDRSNPNAAIFVGVVKEVLPPPPAVIASSPGNASPGIAPTGRRLTGDPVPQISKCYPVVRLQVIEVFSGVNLGDFEVRLTSDHFLGCVPRQVPAMGLGEVWLVDAYRNVRDQQWYTSLCQPTKVADQAAEELTTLRAWAAGQRLPAHFSGEVFNSSTAKFLAGVRVYLRGEQQTLSAVTDDRGRFVIENVAPGVYEAAADVIGFQGPVKVDLTRSWCGQRMLRVK